MSVPGQYIGFFPFVRLVLVPACILGRPLDDDGAAFSALCSVGGTGFLSLSGVVFLLLLGVALLLPPGVACFLALGADVRLLLSLGVVFLQSLGVALLLLLGVACFLPREAGDLYTHFLDTFESCESAFGSTSFDCFCGCSFGFS